MIVSYGGQNGGARAATQLRLVLDAVLLHTIYNEVDLNGTRYLINEQGEARSAASGAHCGPWLSDLPQWQICTQANTAQRRFLPAPVTLQRATPCVEQRAP
jgi:hypothetical protein